MSKMMRSAVFAGALGASALFMGAAPATAQDKDIKFSLQLPLTGPIAFTGQLNQADWQHAIEWINKNGGVKGRKFDPYIYDSEYKVDVGIAGWKKAIGPVSGNCRLNLMSCAVAGAAPMKRADAPSATANTADLNIVDMAWYPPIACSRYAVPGRSRRPGG
jgi:hypothetical protein